MKRTNQSCNAVVNSYIFSNHNIFEVLLNHLISEQNFRVILLV